MIKLITVPDQIAPKGYKCEACPKVLKPRQEAVLMKRNGIIVVCHKKCMFDLLAQVPVEMDTSPAFYMVEFARIKSELARGNIDA